MLFSGDTTKLYEDKNCCFCSSSAEKGLFTRGTTCAALLALQILISMEPVGLYCENCCKHLGKHSIVADCLHAFCFKEDSKRSCAATSGVPGAKRLMCPVCNGLRAAWRVAHDGDRMPSNVRELVYAHVSLPVRGISKSSVAKEIDIIVVSFSMT